MIPVGKLKSNLQFNKNLGDLIEVMKLAATLQFNQFRLKQEPSSEFLTLLDDLFGVLLGVGAGNELLKPREDLPSLLVLISSDEGFLGELNFLLANTLLNNRRRNDIIACTGLQGANYLREIHVDFSFFDSPGEKLDSKVLASLRDFILGQYLKKKIGRVYIVYSRFISISSQQVEIEMLIPLLSSRQAQKSSVENLLVEPNLRSVAEGWVKSWLDFKLYQIFWSSKLSELAARIMHLEGSVQELRRINSRLNMEYFKYLHGLSDKSIRELTAARLINKEKDE
ncbi:MAG: FoF1 ATP synthase subunit gamma [Candidatus Omnitrophota bacterium]|jgi:F-type H+-transporting ATPase subunit gamma